MPKTKETTKDDAFLQHASVFEKQQKALSKLVGHKAGVEVESQQLAIKAIRSSIMMYLDVIPKAEKVFNRYKNERAAYALVSVTNTLRELLKDLAVLSNSTQIGDRIITLAVDPALINLAQGHISGLKELKQYIHESLDSRKHRKKLIRRLDKLIEAESTLIQNTRIQAVEQIENIVNRK